MDMGQFDLSDLEGLTLQQIKLIQEKAKVISEINRKIACRAMQTYEGHFRFMYGSLTDLTNITSDSV